MSIPAADSERGTFPTLSPSRGDMERRVIGNLAAPLTQVNHLTTLLVALLLTVGAFVVLLQVPANPISTSLTERGWVPYAIVLVTMWCLVILLVKSQKVRFQARALRIRVLPDDPQFVLSPMTADQVLERVSELSDEPRGVMLLSRIQDSLLNMRNMLRIGDLGEVLEARAESDEAVSESSYTIVRGLLWMVPILGFVGTVLGLASGIGQFGAVLDSAAEIEALKSALRAVTSDLSTAFDTTLHGLLGALLIHFLLTVTKRREEQLLDQCREYCQRQLVGRVRLATSDGDSQ